MLQEYRASGMTHMLLDVRESHERDNYNIGGTFIPMGEVLANATQIPKEIPVIVYCRKGIRSAIVIQRLQDKFGYENLFNLRGGIEAWKKFVGD